MGYNANGELGDGTTNASYVADEILGSGVTAVAAGFLHSLFLKSDGTVWGMGDNAFGQLGDGTTNNSLIPKRIMDGDVVAISAGAYHSLFLKSDGSLWATGENEFGRLGDGTTVDRYTPTPIITNNVRMIVGGGQHSLVLKTDGSLWGMGFANYGQLGDGASSYQVTTPKQILQGGVVAIAAGGNHSLFVKVDGTLWGMGSDYDSELGGGLVRGKRLFPVLVSPRLDFTASPTANAADRMLGDYFHHETALLAERCLADIKTLDDWKEKRTEYRRQLQEMLGLWPLPERTDLKPAITGKLEHDEFTVEKLHFQASPQLYVTANLYLPKGLTNSVPAILYMCGHSRQFTNGVSFGNKAGYQHHGAWFARNGYACLIIDTLQLGEIEGLHHGTHRLGHWWWNARGYTPAGVEAWLGIRALDYLCSRPEVDKDRIGMTGRSGGGSYSWTVAALDDRVKVVAPVAGITDLQNHVVDGCVEGHCDCMYFVNTYRWDYPMVAALIAPRPLLIVNTDKDTIFPLDGVIRTHSKTRRIYELYGKPANLGLVISDGPHADTQDLQVPVFRWFNRWLKGEASLIEMAAKKFFQPEQLKVFDTLPTDEVNTKIQESFVPRTPLDVADPHIRRKATDALRQKVFAGWPPMDRKVSVTPAFAAERDGLRFRAWDFTSQHDWELRFYVLDKPGTPDTAPIILDVVDETGWRDWLAAMQTVFKSELTTELNSLRTNLPADDARFARWRSDIDSGKALACFAPRGIGLSAWSGDAKAQTHIRRRFMLLGQTLDGMRVWDIHRAIRAIQTIPAPENRHLTLRSRREMGVNALYAALMDWEVASLNFVEFSESHRNGPDYLNVLQLLDIPETLQVWKR